MRSNRQQSTSASTVDSHPEAEVEQQIIIVNNGDEEGEIEQQSLLRSSDYSSSLNGLPDKNQLWSLSIDSNAPAKNSGNIVNIILLVFVSVASLGAFIYHSGYSKIPIDEQKVVPPEDDKLTEETESLNLISTKQRQINNYINGTAIIRNIHITHHAGTSLCKQMTKLGPTPGFACIGKGRSDDAIWPSEEEKEASHLDFSVGSGLAHWEYEDTEAWVKFWRPYFHYISTEYHSFGNLHTTNWEYENLVSMIVMRHPIERFLSGGKCGTFHSSIHEDPSEDNQDLYWEYANSKCADNYALRVLVNESNCVHGEDVSVSCLESAKELLSRFTFIVDKACLDDSMEALGDALNLTKTHDGFETSLHHEHPPLRERFGNDTLYEYVLQRFRHDIELYEWSKERSIVVCNASSV